MEDTRIEDFSDTAVAVLDQKEFPKEGAATTECEYGALLMKYNKKGKQILTLMDPAEMAVADAKLRASGHRCECSQCKIRDSAKVPEDLAGKLRSGKSMNRGRRLGVTGDD